MFFLIGNGKIVSENIHFHIVFSVNHYLSYVPLYYYQYFCLYRRNTHTRRDIKLVFLFKGNTHANVSLNKFDALVFRWIVAMENWKLGYESVGE